MIKSLKKKKKEIQQGLFDKHMLGSQLINLKPSSNRHLRHQYRKIM